MRAFVLVFLLILLAMPMSLAKVTEINTTCGLTDCVSYFNIDTPLTAYVGAKMAVDIKTESFAYGKYVIHQGDIKDVNIEIAGKNLIKISGKIKGASHNLWGFSILGDESHLNSTWWDSSWYYRTEINITNTYGNLVNYPVNISFTSANLDYSKMLSSGCDLRFTDNDSNLLNYWIEKWNVSGTSSVWVNVSSILNNTITSIYAYYGNSYANCTGNASKIFDIYDNFSTNNNNTLWNMTGNVYVNTTAGYLYSYGSETGWNINTLKSISTFSRKEWLIFYGKYYGGTYFSPRWQLSTTATAGEWNPQATTMTASMLYYYQFYLTNVVWTCQQGGCVNNTVWSTDTWSEFKIILRNSGHQWYYRNLSMASWVNPLNTSNCTDTSLKIALAVHGGTAYWDDLRVYQQVPSGISYTFGNETPQSNYGINITFVKDESSLATIQYYNVTIIYSTLGVTSNYTVNSTGSYFIYFVGLSGNAVIRISSDGYNYREYTRTLTNETISSVASYLLPTASSGIVYFYSVTSGGNPVSNVYVNVSKNIGGAYTTMSDGYTDIAGSIPFYLSDLTTYQFTFSRSGYGTVIFNLRPTYGSGYDVSMNTSYLINYSEVWDGVMWNIYPMTPSFDMNDIAYFRFWMYSVNDSIEWQSFNVTWNGTNQLYYSNVTTAYGTTINYTKNTTGMTGNIVAFARFQRTGFAMQTMNITYGLVNYTYASNFTWIAVVNNIKNETSGIPKNVMGIIIIFAIMITITAIGFAIGSPIGIGVISLALMFLLVMIGVLPFEFFILLILSVVAVMLLQRRL